MKNLSYSKPEYARNAAESIDTRETCQKVPFGLIRELNPGPLAP